MIHRAKIVEKSAWLPSNLQQDQSWRIELSPGEADDLRTALDAVLAQGLALEQIDRSNFPLSRCRNVVAKIKQAMEDAELRERIIGAGVAAVDNLDWSSALGRIYEYVTHPVLTMPGERSTHESM